MDVLKDEISRTSTKGLKRLLGFYLNNYKIEKETDKMNIDVLDIPFENKYLLITRELRNRKVNINRYEKEYKELSSRLYL